MPKVVIIGGSYAGLRALSTIYNIDKSANVEVTLVAPSTHVYWNIASPRLLSEPEKFDHTVVALSDLVKQVSSNATYLQGSATSVDFEKRQVAVELGAGGASTLSYDVLVIASGTEAKWAGYKVNTNHEDAKKAVSATNKALKNAKTVAIVGGGPTGVESAGEIAKEFPSVKVTLYTGSKAPLHAVAPSLSGKATNKLRDLGVEVVNDLHVRSVDQGEGALVLANGETHSYDVILESYIAGPYSKYLPSAVKDAKGYVITDSNLLVKGQRGVVAVGDIVSGSANSVIDIKFRQAGLLSATLQKLFKEVGSPEFVTKPTDTQYSPVTHTLVVPISRDGGVGILYSFGVPNFVVRMAKSKTFMIEKARTEYV